MLDSAQPSLELRASLAYVLRIAGRSYKQVTALTGWSRELIKQFDEKQPDWTKKSCRNAVELVTGLYKEGDFSTIERFFSEKGLLLQDLSHVDAVLSGEYANSMDLPEPQAANPAEIPGIPQIFAMAKKHGCSEDELFAELGRSIRADAAVFITGKGVSIVPVADNAEFIQEENEKGEIVEKVRVGPMYFERNELVPDVARRKTGVEQLSKALGVNMKERAALIEADERMRIAREDQKLKREQLEQRKLKESGGDEREVIIEM